VLVNYGGQGGNRCGEQLRSIFEILKLQAVPTKVELKLPVAVLTKQQKLDVLKDFAANADSISSAFKEFHGLLTAPKTVAENGK